MKKIAIAVLLALLPSLALAQTSFDFYQGFVPTAEQWNYYWAYKADAGTLKPVATTGSASDLTTGILPTARLPSCSLSMCEVTVSGIDFNSANSDTPIRIVLPTGFTRFIMFRGYIWGASHSLTTATFTVYSAAAGAGVAITTAATTATVSTASDNTLNNAMTVGVATGTPTMVAASLATPNVIYFRIGTAEGAAATGNFTLLYSPLP